jgi:hypothetical protein
MSVKTRAALRLATHLAISVAAGALIYAALEFLAPTTILTALGVAGVAFFGYQAFKIYVTLEQIKENEKNSA